ncbi:hypothetical protein [Pseudoalteromonas luteoviolacea]|uniref:hypothetical protein n=1 Tax=Pseudoalteromonas luteoviolacea TaxID=43657 RepID=UPI001B36E294|nr:hypothetical protein [Pseudoalteromonas luteoviolacea]MBQ4840132.1 hypothetical protein [Pseudoalteromonas luteoviolacea]
MLIRFSDIPEDLVFEVSNRSDYVGAVYEAWRYVRGDCKGLRCFVEAPDNLPQEWASVPGLLVPQYWGNQVTLYRQWLEVVACAERLTDLSEIVSESKYIDGITDMNDVSEGSENSPKKPVLKVIK